MEELKKLDTEQRNPSSANIDQLSTEEMVRLINREDHRCAEAVSLVLPEIARSVDLIEGQLRRGGRLFYVGAGTSGRLGVLDAAECPPTYGVPPELVTGLIAGGPTAFLKAVEGAEDNPALKYAALRNLYNQKGYVLEMMAAFEDGSCAVSLHAYGQGKAFYIAAEASQALIQPLIMKLLPDDLLLLPEGVCGRRIAPGKLFCVNTTNQAKTVPLAGNAHGWISEKDYTGGMVLPPFEAELLVESNE